MISFSISRLWHYAITPPIDAITPRFRAAAPPFAPALAFADIRCHIIIAAIYAISPIFAIASAITPPPLIAIFSLRHFRCASFRQLMSRITLRIFA